MTVADIVLLVPDETPRRSIRIPTELWERATAKAEAQGENVSTVIRRLLTRWVNRRESDDWGEPDD